MSTTYDQRLHHPHSTRRVSRYRFVNSPRPS